jgi:acyl-coenzyme A synthetase/AMP-(fatty) acid ligase
VPRPGAEPTEQDVQRYCKEKMEMRMVPRHIELVESLPKTTNGKIDGKTLKAREAQEV